MSDRDEFENVKGYSWADGFVPFAEGKTISPMELLDRLARQRGMSVGLEIPTMPSRSDPDGPRLLDLANAELVLRESLARFAIRRQWADRPIVASLPLQHRPKPDEPPLVTSLDDAALWICEYLVRLDLQAGA